MIAITPEHAYLHKTAKIEKIQMNNRIFSHEMSHHFFDDDDHIKEINAEDTRPTDYLMHHANGIVGRLLSNSNRYSLFNNLNSINKKYQGFKRQLNKILDYQIKHNYEDWDDH